MSRVLLLPDTNLFLQCKALEQLPWVNLFSVDQIDLLVPGAVQREIDRLKNDGNRRRARRARQANSLFSRMLDDPNLTQVVREAAPRIVISFAPALLPSRITPETLDRTRADDSIVEEAIVLTQSSTEDSVLILTQDTGLAVTAQRHGIPFKRIPDDWLLEEEPDEQSKELLQLRQRLDRFERAAPVIELSLEDEHGEPVEERTLEVKTFRAPTSADLDELMSLVTARHPLCTDFKTSPPVPPPPQREAGKPTFEFFADRISDTMAGARTWQAPTDELIRKYREHDYPKWQRTTRDIFEKFVPRLNARAHTFTFDFVLENTGMRPAERLLVEFEGFGGLLLMRGKDEDEKYESSPVLPEPPPAPLGHYVRRDTLGEMSRALSKLQTFDPASISHRLYAPGLQRMARDASCFYWNDSSGDPAVLSLTCEQFAHGLDPELISFRIVVPLESTITKTNIRCRVSANNIPEPLVRNFPITLTHVEASPIPILRSWTVQKK